MASFRESIEKELVVAAQEATDEMSESEMVSNMGQAEHRTRC